MDERRTHTPHADRFFTLRKIIFQGFFLQHHAGYVSHGEVDGVALHDMFTLNGSQHAVCPAEFTLSLVLDGGSADEFDMGR